MTIDADCRLQNGDREILLYKTRRFTREKTYFVIILRACFQRERAGA